MKFESKEIDTILRIDILENIYNYMKLKGTEFQIQVWEEIKKIPKGSVKTYKEIACILGKPNSSRAVANACAKNPLTNCNTMSQSY